MTQFFRRSSRPFLVIKLSDYIFKGGLGRETKKRIANSTSELEFSERIYERIENMDGFISKIRSLDAYPKINEDFYSRTLSGGVITLASSIIMTLLFISELRLYLHAVTETKLVVDTSRGETLRINFDITFPALPCSILSVDAMDISGEQHLDIVCAANRATPHGRISAPCVYLSMSSLWK
ncbi:hypothetical protein HAX54_036257 [Datura stramonium]|uniref:Endoplasmic reticulum vesicle transporter N-terminal domain-containing protein n=1 Tax=Datura stramonium TaxID=4076 RepID=A0ABS8VJU8_DATST|nr:hypothetical protein [Datura stramonium]